jgi:flagellar M-ring protein FliF
VHLVLPDRPLFSREKIEGSASIVLKVRGRLDQSQVRAIRHLVAGAVNGLKPQRISVVDEGGRLLADGASDDNSFAGEGADQRKLAYENRLRKDVEEIVSSVVGPGEPSSGGPVSVANELPGAGGNNTGAAATARDNNRKTEEIVNYEISRTTKTEVIEAGRVNRISAAVLVDGLYSNNGKGEMVYQPRTKEEIDRISALVRTAIGFDGKRGDQLEVVNLRFAETAPGTPVSEPSGWTSYLQFSKDDIMQTAQMAVMALLGLLVLLMVVRPLVRRIVTPEGMEPAKGKGGAASATVTTQTAARRPLRNVMQRAGPNVLIVVSEEQVAISNRTSAMIDIAKVQGQVHAESVQKVGEFADKNPQEAASIIRNWLHEDAA